MAYIDTSRITIPKGFFEDLNTPKLLDWLNSQPTADVEEVVRCKDCKYFRCYGRTQIMIGSKNVKAGWCFLRAKTDEERRMTADDFCSYAERSDT